MVKRVMLALAIFANGLKAAPTSSETTSSQTTCSYPRASWVKTFLTDAITFFPPTEPATFDEDSVKAIEVVIGVSRIQILDIDPASATFNARYATDMYWNNEHCTLSSVGTDMCITRLGTWYWV